MMIISKRNEILPFSAFVIPSPFERDIVLKIERWRDAIDAYTLYSMSLRVTFKIDRHCVIWEEIVFSSYYLHLTICMFYSLLPYLNDLIKSFILF